jgi:trans-aconitate 3-methyltransferase
MSFLDDVELKADTWNHIERHKINPEFDMCFYGKEVCDFEVDKVSKIGKEEKILQINDLSFWEKHWDVAGARRFVSAILPPVAAAKETENEIIESLYRDLDKEMGGVRKVTWPVVLILASKK